MQKLAEICVRRPVFATMLILSLVVVGLFSYKSLGVDLFPKVDLPTITVTVVNPGASPQEVETEITDKIEGAVNTVSGIDELRSTSVEGVSQVFIGFLVPEAAGCEPAASAGRGPARGPRGRPAHGPVAPAPPARAAERPWPARSASPAERGRRSRASRSA